MDILYNVLRIFARLYLCYIFVKKFREKWEIEYLFLTIVFFVDFLGAIYFNGRVSQDVSYIVTGIQAVLLVISVGIIIKKKNILKGDQDEGDFS